MIKAIGRNRSSFSQSRQIAAQPRSRFARVLERENAGIGILISLEEPTRPMRREAGGAAFYHSPDGTRLPPRLQLRTIKELLEGKGIDLPPAQMTTFRSHADMNPNPRKAPISCGSRDRIHGSNFLVPAADPNPSAWKKFMAR